MIMQAFQHVRGNGNLTQNSTASNEFEACEGDRRIFKLVSVPRTVQMWNTTRAQVGIVHLCSKLSFDLLPHPPPLKPLTVTSLFSHQRWYINCKIYNAPAFFVLFLSSWLRAHVGHVSTWRNCHGPRSRLSLYQTRNNRLRVLRGQKVIYKAN